MRPIALGTVLVLTVSACISETVDTTACSDNHVCEPDELYKVAHGDDGPYRIVIPSKHVHAP